VLDDGFVVLVIELVEGEGELVGRGWKEDALPVEVDFAVFDNFVIL